MSNDLTHYHNLSIGLNPIVFASLLSDWQKSASDAELLAARDMGVHHWASIAASSDCGGYGVLHLTMDRKASKEDRTYAVAPFPVASIPKALRPAFTSPFPGEVLIDLDWRASHWQILAFRSGDQNLITDLRSGNLYTTLFPGVDRKLAKAGLNTVLNGGGLQSLTESFGAEDLAKNFSDRAHELLSTRYAAAQAEIRKLRELAVSSGWVSEDRSYAGAGVALMRIEAENLRTACSNKKLAEMGMRVVLPMHDGVLASAPAGRAAEIAEGMAKVMAALSTKSRDEATTSTGTWVDFQISKSWKGSTEQLLGADLRAAALRFSTSTSPAELAVAAAAMPQELEAAMAGRHQASAEAKAARAAMAARQAAVAWLAGTRRRHAGATEVHPPIELSHDVPSYTNLCKIFREDKALPDLRWDARSSHATIGGEEAHDTLIRKTYLTALEERYGMLRASEQLVQAAVVDVARENEYDPVLDYFESLTWDGVPRLSTWLHDYAQAVDLADNPSGSGLVRAYGEKWMLGVVARAFKPGCKVDTMLVLLGDQGAKKSSMLREIAPAGSYGDVAIDPSDKDSVLRASKCAIVEWPELSGASKREQESLKAYFTLREDRVRPPYARGDLKIPRRTVFAATTNQDDFLRDSTGSRRYWPIKVGDIDLDGLRAIKDQLWAEAVDLYRFLEQNGSDYRWWLDPAQEAERERQASHFTAEDPLQSKIWSMLEAAGGKITVEIVLERLDVKPTEAERMTGKIRAALKALGCTSSSTRIGGRVVRRWTHPGPWGGPSKIKIESRDFDFSDYE